MENWEQPKAVLIQLRQLALAAADGDVRRQTIRAISPAVKDRKPPCGLH